MADLNISLLQALQLTALLPCLFVVLLLLALSRNAQQVAVPVSYFICLACSFVYPLLPLTGESPEWAQAALLMGQDLQVALSFLLIVQLLSGKSPPLSYWLILAVPVVGGSSLIYGMLAVDEVCLGVGQCIPSADAHLLYQLFAASLILLLLQVHISRKAMAFPANSTQRMHIYWLIVAFILLNVVMLGVDLALLADDISAKDHGMASSIIRLSFIYLVLTSLFRVFDDSGRYVVAPVKLSRYREMPVPPALIDGLMQVMEQDAAYREMGMGRDMLAARLGVSAHHLSKAVNQHFGKNINEYINHYRIEEAKQRLRAETTPVTNIAFEVGFSSIASFNRVFKMLVGQSPTEYRAGVG